MSTPATELPEWARNLPLSLREAEAVATYGLGLRPDQEVSWREARLEVIELAEQTTGDLEAVFEANLSGDDEDFEALDTLVSEGWGMTLPGEDELLAIVLGWGALLGERIVEAVGGAWVLRPDPLHHSLYFPSAQLEFFPSHAVLARFLAGESASLDIGYHRLVEYLVGVG